MSSAVQLNLVFVSRYWSFTPTWAIPIRSSDDVRVQVENGPVCSGWMEVGRVLERYGRSVVLRKEVAVESQWYRSQKPHVALLCASCPSITRRPDLSGQPRWLINPADVEVEYSLCGRLVAKYCWPFSVVKGAKGQRGVVVICTCLFYCCV